MLEHLKWPIIYEWIISVWFYKKIVGMTVMFS